jgi:hypothetical protein
MKASSLPIQPRLLQGECESLVSDRAELSKMALVFQRVLLGRISHCLGENKVMCSFIAEYGIEPALTTLNFLKPSMVKTKVTRKQEPFWTNTPRLNSHVARSTLLVSSHN